MQTSRFVLLCLAALCNFAWAFAPAPLKAPSLTHEAHFFANSVRTDIPIGEGKFLLNIIGPTGLPSCSAYFVANNSRRIYVGTARHCVNFDAPAACLQGLRVKAHATGHVGKCVSVLLDDQDADYVIFEAAFEGQANEYDLVEQLTPVMIYPNGDEELEAYGFPADDERFLRPTKSAQCHLFNVYADPEYAKGFWNFMNEESKRAASQPQGDAKFAENAAKIFKNETMLRHNCSIYGGNSGGPMILKGTHYLVGMPESYNPTKQVFPADTYGFVGTPLHLYSKFYPLFASYGIPFELFNVPKQESRLAHPL